MGRFEIGSGYKIYEMGHYDTGSQALFNAENGVLASIRYAVITSCV